MNRGEKVLVKAFPDKELQRIVWEDGTTYIVVCRPEIYEDALKAKINPNSFMGFPKEDVKMI